MAGEHKALALQAAIEGPINQLCTASALQLHNKVTIVCDFDATIELKVKTLKYFIESEQIALIVFNTDKSGEIKHVCIGKLHDIHR